MSAAWKVSLVCDGCKARSEDTPVSLTNYGPTLRALRSHLASGGWASYRGPGRGRPVRDLCRACNVRRRAS